MCDFLGHVERRGTGGLVVSRAVSTELVVASLQQQLREKDLKLTDIRLEALTSAHQLDHLRDAVNRMQVPPFYRQIFKHG